MICLATNGLSMNPTGSRTEAAARVAASMLALTKSDRTPCSSRSRRAVFDAVRHRRELDIHDRDIHVRARRERQSPAHRIGYADQMVVGILDDGLKMRAMSGSSSTIKMLSGMSGGPSFWKATQQPSTRSKGRQPKNEPRRVCSFFPLASLPQPRCEGFPRALRRSQKPVAKSPSCRRHRCARWNRRVALEAKADETDPEAGVESAPLYMPLQDQLIRALSFESSVRTVTVRPPEAPCVRSLTASSCRACASGATASGRISIRDLQGDRKLLLLARPGNQMDMAIGAQSAEDRRSWARDRAMMRPAVLRASAS